MDVVFVIVAANALLTLIVGLYIHRIAVHIQEKDEAVGRLMQTLFEKLDQLPDLPQNFEAPNPFAEIIAQIVGQKIEQTNIGRSDVGQFTRAEIIPPE